ncbi:MAG: alternative ribosome rescue aminoacyl-tRNA hydrolase ArfB [Bacteriovorax sp.]|nr:alternative ribosome rescue aminoacyl-tRNA hydrolase ArfB [Bacteriovorax sp.]
MPNFKIPESEFTFSFSRSSGPGGQNVNKVNTKATLHWNAFANTSLPKDVLERFIKKYFNRLSDEGVLTLVSQKSRSQTLNTTDVVEKLYEMINSVAVAPKKRLATKPSRGSINKRLNEKKSHGDKKKSRQEKY